VLNWCDNNIVFIVDVSRVCANSLPQKLGKKQKSKRTHTLHLRKFSELEYKIVIIKI